MISHADLAEVRDYNDSLAGILGRLVSNALDHTPNLPSLMSRAFELAACERSLGTADSSPHSPRIGVEAGLALFAAAAAPNQPVTYSLTGKTVIRPGLLGPDSAHIGRWETTSYGAASSGETRRP